MEHMEKEEAKNLVEELLRISKIIFISIPIVHFPQGIVHSNPYEERVKYDWTHEEVISAFPEIVAFFAHKDIGIYLLSTAPEMAQPLQRLNDFLGRMLKEQVPDDDIMHYGPEIPGVDQ